MKLHGSLNWFYSGAASFYGETIYGSRPTPGWRPESGETAPPFDKVPLIVPPTSQKSPYFANETLNTQWSAAASSLSNATDIFFLGYSLPETDQMVRFMLSGLSLPELKTVWIVNQGSETEREAIFDRYQRAMPKVTLRRDYLIEKDPIPALVKDFPHGLPDGPRGDPDWYRMVREIER